MFPRLFRLIPLNFRCAIMLSSSSASTLHRHFPLFIIIEAPHCHFDARRRHFFDMLSRHAPLFTLITKRHCHRHTTPICAPLRRTLLRTCHMIVFTKKMRDATSFFDDFTLICHDGAYAADYVIACRCFINFSYYVMIFFMLMPFFYRATPNT